MPEILEPGSGGELKPDLKQEPVDFNDAALWLEPQVQSFAMFTELFKFGDRTEAQMIEMLTRNTTTVGWIDFWSKEGYLTEVVRGSERCLTISAKAVQLLELP